MPISDMAVRSTGIDGLLVMTMKVASDERGAVREFFRGSAYDEVGAAPAGQWRQVNVTETVRGAVRGLHGEDMVKLVAVVAGEAFGVYVDARAGSPTHGAVEAMRLTPGTQVFVPSGVCNGFQATADRTQYLYCFDREWEPVMDGLAFTPLDPDLGIEWPVPIDPDDRSQISIKDRDAPRFSETAMKRA